MASDPKSGSAAQVDLAIARVLAAEQQAQASLVATAQEGEARREAARSSARAIAARAEARVAACRASIEAELASAGAEVDSRIAALRQASGHPPQDTRALASALEALVRELTGAR